MILYPKLALEGIRKNKRLYFPYLLAGCVMIMMYYILHFLTETPALANIPGGSVLKEIFPLGCAIIAIFSVLFLFYSNSFLIKQRYREFGLYNILGMDKHNIGRVMLWESIFTCLIVLALGLFAGILLSKTAELILLNLLNMEITFEFTIGTQSILQTILVFLGIYLLLLVNSLIKVRRSRPLELIESSKVGEKIPKYTWIFALIGIVLVGVAYYLAVTIDQPLTALSIFFLAVILVIIGTYLLFISGSITFCRILQKNKKYYYKPNHFVSVSSMVYRMKRNGAGLASICILSTMVLVMISSTASLYFGEEDSLNNRYPSGVNIEVTYADPEDIRQENLDELRNAFAQFTDANLSGMRSCSVSGMFVDEKILIDRNNIDFNFSYDNVGTVYAIPLDEYNRVMHTDETLAEDECLLYSDRVPDTWENFSVEYGNSYKIKKKLKDFKFDGEDLIKTTPYVYLIVNDIEKFAEPIEQKREQYEGSMITYAWSCNFDEPTPEKEVSTAKSILQTLENIYEEDGDLITIRVHSRETQRNSFYELYGSLFFLGITLSIVFLLAAVLIIYYKQISEGYEDRSRFEIMQKVGMTGRDIRRSINSQMLTVFFLPLIMAGIHLVFAYPFISKILIMFAFDSPHLNLLVNLICFAIFGVFYAIVYKITSSSYYAIVSGKKEERL